MQAVKLRPDELLLEVVKSDWLLLWRVLPRGLPNPGDEPGAPDLLTEFFELLCGVLPPTDAFSDGYIVPKVSSSPRFEEKTRSREGNFSIHSTLETGKQLNLI